MRRLLRWILGLKVCVECGAVCASWGRTVKLWQPHSDSDEYAYECERCSNDGVPYNEFKRGHAFELAHPDSRFTWGNVEIPRVVNASIREDADGR